jgi:glutathione S-transferase
MIADNNMASGGTVTLFDLAGADDNQRISPFCWRIRMALAHKGVNYSAVPWRLVEKERIKASAGMTAPVLLDGDAVIGDSWRIAEYLETRYPDRPLFDSKEAKAYCRWIHCWTERVLHPLIVPLILEDVLSVLHPKDVSYFVQTREEAFRRPLAEVCDRSPEAYSKLFAATSFLKGLLRDQKFVSGEKPSYGDYVLFGAFQWARCCSAIQLFRDKNDPLATWFDLMLDLYDGLGRRAMGPGEPDTEPAK